MPVIGPTLRPVCSTPFGRFEVEIAPVLGLKAFASLPPDAAGGGGQRA